MTDASYPSSQPTSRAQSQSATSGDVKSRTDGGTILLHWVTAASMLASLLTGLRISADGQFTSWAKALEFALPQGEMWTWHLLASLVLFFCTIAYFVYMRRAALSDRVGAARLRTLTPPTTTKLRWRAINVALHWFAYGAIAMLTLTGVVLYIGYGGWFVTIHKAFAWAMLFYIAIHTLAHFLYGGLDQILRLFRPQPLVENATSRLWPMSVALAAGTVFAAGAYAIDSQTRPTTVVGVVDTAPTLDGNLSDPQWETARFATMPTQQGANLGGGGESSVDVKAVRTSDMIYFAFVWDDPTRSLMRSPTIKKADGWHVISTDAAIADVNDYYEDKFAVLFSHSDKLGGGKSTFLGKDPLKAYPSSPHKRGLHYTDDGRVMDLWQWKSSRGGMTGHVDDMHFGPPKKPSKAQLAGKKRYAAGYASDPGKAIYEYNYIADGPKGYESPVRLKRLPKDWVATTRAMGAVPLDADGHNDEGSIWWMNEENSVPYDAALDQTIPLGTMLPSTLHLHTYQGDRADLAGGAKWKDGRWTLEVARKLDTGSAFDMAFHSGTRIYLWVSVFDHNQIRHTRHQRSIELIIQ